MGMRDISSTPHATATSTTPEATRLVATFVACWDDPHWVSTVVTAVVWGSPAVSQAVRPTLKDCSPTWLTQPVTTCSTARGSIPERVTTSLSAVASRSAGWTVDRSPFRRPIGVRAASTITTSAMYAGYGGGVASAKRCSAGGRLAPGRRSAPTAGLAVDGVEHEEEQGGAHERHEDGPEVELVERAGLVARGEAEQRPAE